MMKGMMGKKKRLGMVLTAWLATLMHAMATCMPTSLSSIQFYLIQFKMFHVLGGDWDPTDKKFSSVASENAEPRTVILILCQIVEATSCHMRLQHALLGRSGTRVLEVSQAACCLKILEILMTGQDHIACSYSNNCSHCS